jgi:hypothetical protein
MNLDKKITRAISRLETLTPSNDIPNSAERAISHVLKALGNPAVIRTSTDRYRTEVYFPYQGRTRMLVLETTGGRWDLWCCTHNGADEAECPIILRLYPGRFVKTNWDLLGLVLGN